MTYTDRAKSMLAAAVREDRINEFRAEWPEASITAFAAASGWSARWVVERMGNPNLWAGAFPDEVEPWPSQYADRFIVALADRWPPHPVVSLYWDILDRDPDPAGFDHWRKRLEAVGLAQLEREFLANISDEDRARLAQ